MNCWKKATGCPSFVPPNHDGFDVTKGGMEYALMQLLISIALFIAGAGTYSLAPWLPKPLQKW
jgi:hypothetical protein